MGASPGSSFGQGMTRGEEPTLGSPTATDSTITACGPSRLAFCCDTSRDTSQQYFGHERFEVKLAPVDVRLTGGVNTRVRGGPKAIPLFSAGCHSLFLAASQVPGRNLVLITTVWGTLLVE